MGNDEGMLVQMLDLLARVRNVCAHNERLFDYKYQKRTIGEVKEDFWYKQYCDYNYSNAGGESALVILNGKLNPADYFIIRFGNDTITDIASYPQKRTAYRDLIAAGCSFSYDDNAKSRKGSGHGKCNYRKRVEKIL